MGVEQDGSYFEYGGGSGDYGGGDYGGGYDIGVDYASYYGGGYGSYDDLSGEYGTGVGQAPGTVSPEGDAIAWGFDTTSWPTLDQGGGDFGPVADQALMIDPFTGLMDVGDGYLYDPVADQFYDTGQGGFGDFNDTWRTEYEGWLAFGVDPDTAAGFADQALEEARAAAGVISISQSASELERPPDLPDFAYYPLPYVNNYNPWETPPYVPTFPDLPTPLPPVGPLPKIPLVTQQPVLTAPKPPSQTSGAPPKAPGLPPACPGGQYHPYPIGHPSQNVCVPFPPAQGGGSSGGQKSGGGSSGGGTSKPPTQQQQPTRCATGQYYSNRARRCVVIPKCPTGFVFDPVLETCVRTGTQTSRLPTGEGEPNIGDSLGELFKNTPWWLWGAVAALLLLGGNSEQRKRVTVQHRRAT